MSCKPVRDDDLRDAVLLELEHGLEQPLGRHDREIGGRLVEDDHARLERDGAGDGDRLLPAARQALDPLKDRIDVDLEPLQHLVGLRYILRGRRRCRCAANGRGRVLADIHVPAEREVLVDHLDDALSDASAWANAGCSAIDVVACGSSIAGGGRYAPVARLNAASLATIGSAPCCW